MAWRAFDNPKYTKRMIADAKKGKEVCWTFMPDKATGEHEFALDTGIAGEMLFKKLRTHSNARRGKEKKKKLTKGAWGTCRIKGKTIFVTAEQEVPSLRMLLKRRLLSEEFQEFKLNEVRILKPGEEAEEEPEEKAEKADAPKAATARSRTQQQEEEEAQAATTPSAAARRQEAEEAQAATTPRATSQQQEEEEAQAATGDVNPFSGEAAAATAARPSRTTAAAVDPKQAAKEKKDAQKKRAAFKKARQTWVSTREQALKDLEVVKDAFRKEYMDDPQIKDVNKRIKELDSVMDDLGDDLREALDAYVATPLGNKKALDEQAAKAQKLLRKFSSYVDKSQLLAAVDGEKGVGDASKVKVKAPLGKALKGLAKTIG